MITNFNEFCKAKKCVHYKEWHIQAGKNGMVRCCELAGASFYITKYPDNCVHIEEMEIAMKEANEQHKAWKKLNRVNPMITDITNNDL